MAERTVDWYVPALPDGQREIAEAVRREPQTWKRE
jgi:hypothetical protein